MKLTDIENFKKVCSNTLSSLVPQLQPLQLPPMVSFVKCEIGAPIQESTPIVARKRGRPKLSDDAASAKKPRNGYVQKRGRPPKLIALPDMTNTKPAMYNDSSMPLKKRGRPRKTEVDESGENGFEVQPVPKKPRGRPKKVEGSSVNAFRQKLLKKVNKFKIKLQMTK